MHRSEEPAISDRYGVNPPYTPLAQRSRALRYERRFVGGSNPSRRARRVPVDGKGLTKRRANGW